MVVCLSVLTELEGMTNFNRSTEAVGCVVSLSRASTDVIESIHLLIEAPGLKNDVSIASLVVNPCAIHLDGILFKFAINLASSQSLLV